MSRTLVLTNDLPPRSGGIETFIHELLRRQPADTVAVLGPAQENADTFDAHAPYEIVRHDSSVLPTPRLARRAVDVAKALGCDNVMLASATPLGVLVPRLIKSGLPVSVVMTHGNEAGWASVPGAGRALGRISSASFVTYLGDYTRDRIAPALSPATRMRRLAPAVDAQRFRPDIDGWNIRQLHGLTGRVVIGCVSRLVARKGQDRLIAALPLIRQYVPEAMLLLVGDGPDRKRLEGLVGQHGVSAHVTFAGRASDEDLPAYYAACDIFALPCRTQRWGIDVEGLGIVLLEASATGKPVVAGASGGAPDAVIDGHTGLVVGDDLHALANTLINLITDDTRAAAMGAAGRDWVLDSWTWQTPAGRLAAMLSGSDPDA
jgi:phosphatidyl-myo-inositol dimannoside synthase